MWMIFGNRAKVRLIEGGRAEERRCPRCKATRPFVECDVADELHLYFVPVLRGTMRRMVCTVCGEDVEPGARDQRATRGKAEPADPSRSPTPPTEKELEGQLAALKRKMNRGS